MESNVDKALRIDEWTAEALTTSCVDDTFFILHKCGTRRAPAGRVSRSRPLAGAAGPGCGTGGMAHWACPAWHWMGSRQQGVCAMDLVGHAMLACAVWSSQFREDHQVQHYPGRDLPAQQLGGALARHVCPWALPQCEMHRHQARTGRLDAAWG